jgi:predicted PurR-regulated permease PerM
LNRTDLPRSANAALWFLALACLIYAVFQIYDPLILPVLEVIPPFAAALLLAFMLDPLVDRIQQRGPSRGIGVAIVGTAFLVIVITLAVLVVPLISRQAQDLSANYETYAKVATQRIDSLITQLGPTLEQLKLPTTLEGWTSKLSPQVQSTAEQGLSLLGTALSSMFSKVLWLVIVPLAGLWLLKDIDYIKQKIVHLTPEHYREKLTIVGTAVGAVFFKYLKGMASVALIYSVVASILFTSLGLQYGLIIGCISGILYLVPYIGVLAIMCISGISVLVQPDHSMQMAGIVVGLVAVMSFGLFDQLITPKVVGGSVGVHPVLSLFSLALGARLFGVVGVIVAVPITAAIQVVIGEFYPQIYDKLTPVPVVKRIKNKPDQKST